MAIVTVIASEPFLFKSDKGTAHKFGQLIRIKMGTPVFIKTPLFYVLWSSSEYDEHNAHNVNFNDGNENWNNKNN